MYAAHRSFDGAIWIGTRENGLMRYLDGETKTIGGVGRVRMLAISDAPDNGVLAATDTSLLWANQQGVHDIQFGKKLQFNRNGGWGATAPGGGGTARPGGGTTAGIPAVFVPTG